ncbi:DUF6545 domain-containing protein [Streptomyces sp. NRRL B-1347]|uniref:DUF6545 domain-containing protein n=1 Tax=Streptomyces sp. NRRL B-1347 TaxID=1476877 RepID=UPI003B64146F
MGDEPLGVAHFSADSRDPANGALHRPGTRIALPRRVTEIRDGTRRLAPWLDSAPALAVAELARRQAAGATTTWLTRNPARSVSRWESAAAAAGCGPDGRCRWR